jgi:hypothetical protein
VSTPPRVSGEPTQAARLRAEIIYARAEWLSWRLTRERRRCAEALERMSVLPDGAGERMWDLFDLGDIEEIEAVAPTLRVVDEPDES